MLRTALVSTALLISVGAIAGVGGCSSEDAGASGAESVFLPNADLTNEAQFFDVPYPSDTRLTAKGTPDLRGYPIPEIAAGLVKPLRDIASERRGFPMTSIAYFRFRAELAEHKPVDTVEAAIWTPEPRPPMGTRRAVIWTSPSIAGSREGERTSTITG